MLTVSELATEDVTSEVARSVSRLMTVLADAPRQVTDAELRNVAQANHLFLAAVGAEIVGLICLVPMHLPQGVRLWLESVIVDPAHRGVGLGRALMAAAMAKAATYGDVPISLTSNPTRTVAHQLFEQFGFSRADTSVFRRRARP